MKNPGMLVETQTGRTYNKEPLVNGKVSVHVIDKLTFHPKIDENTQKPMKLLCDPSTLTVKGYID